MKPEERVAFIMTTIEVGILKNGLEARQVKDVLREAGIIIPDGQYQKYNAMVFKKLLNKPKTIENERL